MLVSILDARNPKLDPERLADLAALYHGGEAFDARVQRFIPQRPAEKDDIYRFRLKCAHYLNYAGPIVDYFPSALFTGRLEMRRRDNTEGVPEWFGEWKEDCDGIGTDLVDFLRDRTTWALVKGRSWALIDFPQPDEEATVESKAEWAAAGLDKGYLCPIEDEDVLSWKKDRRGALQWAIIKWVGDARENPGDSDDMVVEQWTIWTRDTWERWELRWSRKEGRPPPETTSAMRLGGGKHATPGKVPLVAFEVPKALHVMNRIASPQLEQTRARNAESWGLQRTCFAMRIFKLEDKESSPPVQAPGYGMVIGTEEEVEWDAPPPTAFEPIAKYSEQLKDEIYRVTHQMALGVKNNAAAIGRSAESKGADNDATEVVLRALAPTVREATEKLLDLLTIGKGETDLVWSVTGLDSFKISDVSELIDNAIKAKTLNIPSPTLNRLSDTRVALAFVPDASQDERDAIVKEIEENTPKEWTPPKPLELGGGTDDAGDAGGDGKGEGDGAPSAGVAAKAATDQRAAAE